MMNELTTACGKTVSLEAARVELATLGLLEGSSHSIMERIVERAGQRFPWGPQFPTYLLRPTITRHTPYRSSLPGWLVYAQMASSWDGGDEDAHGTHLTLAFFADDALRTPMIPLVQERLKLVDWGEKAEPFSV